MEKINLTFYVNVFKSRNGNYFCFGNFKSIETAEIGAVRYKTVNPASTFIKTELININ